MLKAGRRFPGRNHPATKTPPLQVLREELDLFAAVRADLRLDLPKDPRATPSSKLYVVGIRHAFIVPVYGSADSDAGQRKV